MLIQENAASSKFLSGIRDGPSQNLLLGLGLLVAVVLTYSPVWHAGFIWDDDLNVHRESRHHRPAGIERNLDDQRSQLSLTLACDLQIAPAAACSALRARHDSISTQKEADAYIREVDDKICARRTATAGDSALRVMKVLIVENERPGRQRLLSYLNNHHPIRSRHSRITRTCITEGFY